MATFALEMGPMFIMSGFISNGVFLPTLVATVQKSATRNECVTIKSCCLFSFSRCLCVCVIVFLSLFPLNGADGYLCRWTGSASIIVTLAKVSASFLRRRILLNKKFKKTKKRVSYNSWNCVTVEKIVLHRGIFGERTRITFFKLCQSESSQRSKNVTRNGHLLLVAAHWTDLPDGRIC